MTLLTVRHRDSAFVMLCGIFLFVHLYFSACTGYVGVHGIYLECAQNPGIAISDGDVKETLSHMPV